MLEFHSYEKRRKRRLTLRPLERQTQRAVPDVLRERTKRAGHTEDNGVVLELAHAVVVEHAAGRGVDVRVRVLRLAVLLENVRRNLRGLS